MQSNALVVTADLPFGELLRQSLMETGRFNVCVTSESRRAVSYLLETNCDLVFIDSGQDEQDMLAIGRRLRETRPALRFVVIAESGWHSALEEFSPEDYLSKPYYQPDLLEIVEKMVPASQTHGSGAMPTPETGENAPPWLSDVTRAAQHLTRLTLESSAQAALITSNQQLWAYAGQLPQTAARELGDTVTRYWDRAEENDLVRFVRLNSTNAEHMLYATRLAPGMVLALVFDAETPFSTIRSQASQLVHSLAAKPVESEVNEVEEQVPTAFLSDILSNVPPPNPEPEPELEEAGEQEKPARLPNWFSRATETTKRLFPSRNDEAEAESVAETQRHDLSDVTLHFSRETSPAIPLNMVDTDDEHAETRQHVPMPSDDELAMTMKSRATRKAEMEMAQAEDSETQPGSITDVARKIVLEPVSPSVYNLDYACILVPRFTQHHLTGDLSERLGEWVQQICVAFGWRLEYISVRPEFLQWIVNVPPATSPAYLMRIMRQHTSEKIFTEFPRFAKENPSGDFWAPGYLIMGGSQPPPPRLIKDFIVQTRQRQGIPLQMSR
jgi:REP element-mobilizing transposase RayT/CheY-like chemotaxis protein